MIYMFLVNLTSCVVFHAGTETSVIENVSELYLMMYWSLSLCNILLFCSLISSFLVFQVMYIVRH